MSKGINLLPTQAKNTVVILNKLQLVRIVAVILLFGVSFLSLGLSLFIAFSPLPKLRQTEAELIAYTTSLHPKIAKQMLLVERMTYISTIVRQRSSFDTMIALLQDTFPRAVAIEQFSMKEKELTIVITNNSLALIDTAITNLQQLNTTQKLFSRITAEDISYSYEQARYTATILLVLK